MKIFDWLLGKTPPARLATTDYELPMRSEPDFDAQLFLVSGAGYISLSGDGHSSCGQSIGFCFGVSWGRHGYVGGVIGRTQALRLARIILSTCEGITESEMDEYFRKQKELQDKMIAAMDRDMSKAFFSNVPPPATGPQ